MNTSTCLTRNPNQSAWEDSSSRLTFNSQEHIYPCFHFVPISSIFVVNLWMCCFLSLIFVNLLLVAAGLKSPICVSHNNQVIFTIPSLLIWAVGCKCCQGIRFVGMLYSLAVYVGPPSCWCKFSLSWALGLPCVSVILAKWWFLVPSLPIWVLDCGFCLSSAIRLVSMLHSL